MSSRVGVYGLKTTGVLRPLAELFGAEWRTDYEGVEDFDFVVTDGLRGSMRQMLLDYRAAGVPAVVTDLGFVRRDLGYMYVGLNGHNWKPGPCPSDRWERLGVSIKPRRDGKYIVIAGQKPGDGSHGMSLKEIADWARNTVAALDTDRRVIWRPHPRMVNVTSMRECVLEIEGAELDLPSDNQRGGLAELLEGAHALVCINSTSGTDALLAGVPVFCDKNALYPAQYEELANTDLSDIEHPYFPDEDALLSHFYSVAYAQWRPEEMDEAAKFIVGQM